MAWDYLDDATMQVRQVLAGHFLRGCPRVLEIGGYKNPVTFHLKHGPDEVLVLDPLIEPLAQDELYGRPCSVRHVAADIVEFDFGLWLQKEFGMVFCGMDLYQGEHSSFRWLEAVCQFLFVLSRSSVGVIEYPLNWQRSANLFGIILSTLQPRIAADVRIDLTRYHETGSVSDEVRTRLLRRLTVLKDFERVERREDLHEAVARILFGSEGARAILSRAATLFEDVPDALPLASVLRQGDRALVNYRDGVVSVTTAPEAWSYAALVPIADDAAAGIRADRQQPALVEVQVYVDAGQAGFGVLHRNYREIAGERLLKASPGLQTIEIFVPDIRNHAGLICRNGDSAHQPAQARIGGLRLSLATGADTRR